MYILRTLNVNIAKAMSIKLNTKETDITVYDKSNLKHGTGKDIVPLLSHIVGDFKQHIIDIFFAGYDSKDSTKDVFTLITEDYHSGAHIDIKTLVSYAAKYLKKSDITIKRSIDNLVYKGIVRRNNSEGYIVVNKEYDVNSIYNTAKYIVIEIN